ncbi:polysaccharide deacetylase family protein [Aureisphaera galaxeae]|uniref:polysaccharide deacetylase family protein n=1 Tax=Aureisphaera galaxeae TaxID=1538023 RepID=UPI00234FE1A4|nr:polysaccharide deacetylase family protein [Aureisphaera galaxeae]MDC8005885.1 polysaccharide deacetylase family protein [Aureisphaera galaxeae]
MRPYRVKTPSFLQRIFPKRVWRLPNNKKEVYLTFDDGPIPEVTPWVLDTLKKHQAKGTFFCIGDNAVKHPDVFQRILSEGHSVGNHTFNHLNGWKTPTREYVENTVKAEETLQLKKSKLFRPPYGKIRVEQSKALRNLGYHIIMWDVLSADFDPSVSKELCFQNVCDHMKPGSIVVFHDSLKAEERLRHALPKVLEHIDKEGWNCNKIAF